MEIGLSDALLHFDWILAMVDETAPTLAARRPIGRDQLETQVAPMADRTSFLSRPRAER